MDRIVPYVRLGNNNRNECDFCYGKSELYNDIPVFPGDGTGVKISIDDKKILILMQKILVTPSQYVNNEDIWEMLELKDRTIKLNINYCPMCGRKL